MKILHTEASPGWGGQEMRILAEAQGMRARGYEIIFAIQEGGGLVTPARESGFLVYEMPFRKSKIFQILYQLLRIIHKHHIDIINTHSSLDSWMGGIVGTLRKRLVIRTRHLSTPIRSGINSRILYDWLVDFVVTTCEDAAQAIRTQANLPLHRCLSIPTGVDPLQIRYDLAEVAKFREQFGIRPDDCLAGTLCVLRGWKGVTDLLCAAKLLEHIPNLKWMVIGAGVSEQHFKEVWKRLGLEHKVIFTGYLSPPFTALAALDIFLLLSWANEGVSQASLQAAWLEKPLVTTSVGGLSEVCIENKTGLQVPKNAPKAVADAVLKLVNNKKLRTQMGMQAKKLVIEKFTLKNTLDQMESLYSHYLSLTSCNVEKK